MTSRRNVLFLVGGGVVLAAGAAGGVIAASQPSGAARKAWAEAGRYEEFRRRALSYAILAPNPHNRQPWVVRLEAENGLSLFCDLERRLPVTDPFDRQITIGCGAFLELLAIAAAEDGYAAAITPFPDGEDMRTLDARPVARVEFTAGAARPDPLFSRVLDRRSNKEPYQARPVPPDQLAALEREGSLYGLASRATDDAQICERLRDLIFRAHYLEVTTPAANQESIDLMRIGAREVAANPDGIELEGPIFTVGGMLGVLNRKTLADPNSEGFRQGVELYRELAKASPAFGWIANANGSRADQINAGRAYARLNLRATELGLGVHPWSQSLQEYPEMAGLFDEVHELISPSARLQMLYRIGYAPDVIPTPRRGLEAHLV